MINTAMFLLPLVATACGSSEEAPKISEDQMNHYAGVPEHDHPTNSSTSAPPRPAMPDLAKSSSGHGVDP